MRLLAFGLVIATLTGCAAQAPETELLSATPAAMEIAAWCGEGVDAACRQRVADQAQGRCRAEGKNAQYVRSSLIERSPLRGERWHFVYNCV